MIEYGLLASKTSGLFSDTSEMFSNGLSSLRDLFYSHPYVIIPIIGFAIVFYFWVWK